MYTARHDVFFFNAREPRTHTTGSSEALHEYKRTHRRTTHGHTDARTHGRTDVRTDGRTDGTDGRTHADIQLVRAGEQRFTRIQLYYQAHWVFDPENGVRVTPTRPSRIHTLSSAPKHQLDVY